MGLHFSDFIKAVKIQLKWFSETKHPAAREASVSVQTRVRDGRGGFYLSMSLVLTLMW